LNVTARLRCWQERSKPSPRSIRSHGRQNQFWAGVKFRGRRKGEGTASVVARVGSATCRHSLAVRTSASGRMGRSGSKPAAPLT
jgi:hypothetical protein